MAIPLSPDGSRLAREIGGCVHDILNVLGIAALLYLTWRYAVVEVIPDRHPLSFSFFAYAVLCPFVLWRSILKAIR